MLNILCTFLEQVCIYMPLILGSYCAFSVLKVPFLAIESSYVFGGLMGSLVLLLNLGPFFGLVFSSSAALLGGAFVGLVTCIVRYYAHISFLLASIISLGLFHGINQMIIHGTHVSLSTVDGILSLIPSVQGYPQLATLIIVALIITSMFFCFSRSALGLSCSIYGNNPDFFTHYNISSYFVQFACIVVSSSLAGISGFLNAGVNGFADISMGFGINLFCITMIILGKAFTKVKYGIMIPIFGIVSYFILQQVLLQIHFDSRYFIMVQACIVFVLLVLTQIFTKGKKYEQGL